MANRERSNSFNTIKYFILNATTYLTNTDILKRMHFFSLLVSYTFRKLYNLVIYSFKLHGDTLANSD